MSRTNNVRLIARMDIKGKNLIKSIQLEGLRVMGSPNEFALRYYLQGADELIYMDCVASLYGRNHLADIVSAAAKNIFIPTCLATILSPPNINLFALATNKILPFLLNIIFASANFPPSAIKSLP